LSINQANAAHDTENHRQTLSLAALPTGCRRLLDRNDHRIAPSSATVRPDGFVLIVFLFRLLSRLPLGLLHRLGDLGGWLVYLFFPTYRERMREHLRLAGLEHVRPAAIRQTGRAILELPWVWLRPSATVLARVEVEGWDLVRAARAAQRGIVFLTPHLGCFEVTAQLYASRDGGQPITVLYRVPRKAWLRPLVEDLRQRPNMALARADLSGVRRLLRALKRGEAVGLLPDQVPAQGEGVWARFFGRDAYTMTLPLGLHQASGATILLACGERLAPGTGWRVRIFPYAPPSEGSTEARAAHLNAALEEVIRECPEQYLWTYNRYKQPAGARPAPAQDARA